MSTYAERKKPYEKVLTCLSNFSTNFNFLTETCILKHATACRSVFCAVTSLKSQLVNPLFWKHILVKAVTHVEVLLYALSNTRFLRIRQHVLAIAYTSNWNVDYSKHFFDVLRCSYFFSITFLCTLMLMYVFWSFRVMY